MCKVIAVAMQKGGCAKTSVSLNLGIGLSREGKKVLLIDNDPQGSLTASMGYDQPDEIAVTLASIMMKIINEEEIEPEYGILHHEEGVDLIPANIELSGLEVLLANVMSRESILKEYLDQIKDQYEYIIIDCMPSLGIMTINRVRQKSANWYDRYYGIMEKQRKDNKSFEDILRSLYEVGGCLDVSFASKLMATIDPELPIWDQYVIQNLGLKNKWEKKRNSDVESRIMLATEIYREINQWYIDFISSPEGSAGIDEFDRALPKYKDLLTAVKKIDYLLWSKR